jgi:branched-chain amino acid transport system ATP-binding protein
MRRGLLWNTLFYGPSRREEIENRARVEEALALLEIGRLRHAKVGQLAYGQQKMVSIARAIAMEPRLLLLDEPASGLTFSEKGSIARLVGRLRSVTRLTQVLIEHDVRLIAEVCDYVYVLNFGHVIAAGTPEQVLSDPIVVEAYLGKPEEDGGLLGPALVPGA